MNAMLYVKVYESLRARIEARELPVGAKLASQNTLAEEFGVSVITVKHALDLLQRDGYIERRPRLGSVVVSATRSGTTREATRTLPTVGCIVTDFDDSFGTRILYGLFDAGIGVANLVVSRTRGYHEREEMLLAQYDDLAADGLIMLPSSSAWIPPAILGLVARKVPLVVLDRNLGGLPISTVCSDNVASGRAAAEHLFELGHRTIGLVMSAGEVSTLDDRHAGFVYAHASRGFPFDAGHEFRHVRSVIPHSEVSIEQDVAELKGFIQANPDLTGFVAGEYSAGLLLRRACVELGLRVPGNLSIVSFDAPAVGFDDARQPFTHVAQDQTGLGRAALEAVIQQIGEPGTLVKASLPTTFVLGETSAPPPPKV